MVSAATVDGLRNNLNSLLLDSLSIVTYKLLSKKFNVPYDVSKYILYQYLTENGEVRIFP